MLEIFINTYDKSIVNHKKEDIKMSMLKEKLNIDEFIYTLMMMSLGGLIIMWLFFGNFPDHAANVTYLVLAIVFTVLTPLFFVLLYLRKKKA
jgi:hypothetical protein